MKDFAGSRSTYYSLAREKLRGEHPRIFNLLLILSLMCMTGLAAFLLSDIVSFGLNSDHESVLAGLKHIDPVKRVMSIIDWNENNIKPAVSDNPVVQKGGLISLSVANSSPKISVTGRLGMNISGEKNGSPFQMDSPSQKIKEKNPSNSSPMPDSFSSKRVSSNSAGRNTGSGTSSNKLAKEKGTTDLIKTHSGFSGETPISRPPKQRDKQKDLNYANDTQVNSTQVNSTQVNSTQVNSTQANCTQVNDPQINSTQSNCTQVNSKQANSTQLSNIQTDNTSTDQIQIKETSTIKSPINETSMSQPQINPSPPKSSQIIQSQIIAAEADSSHANPSSNKPQSNEPRTIKDPAIKETAIKETAIEETAIEETAIKETAIEETAKEESKNGNGLSDNGNKKTSEGDSPANPVAAPTIEAQNTVEKTALTKSAADIRADSPNDPAKDVSAKNALKIRFKTDSTTSPKSENSLGGVHKGSRAVSGASATSSSIASERSPVQYKKIDARDPGDSTSISKSPITGKGNGSARKHKPAVTSKTEKAKEIRYQKIANKNRLAENAKKKAANARERAR